MKIIVGNKFHHDHDAIIGDLKEDSRAPSISNPSEVKPPKITLQKFNTEAFQMEIPNLEIIISRASLVLETIPNL